MSREFHVFAVYTITVLAVGSVFATRYGLASDYAFAAGFGVGALALDPVRDRLKRRKIARRVPDEDARPVDERGENCGE